MQGIGFVSFYKFSIGVWKYSDSVVIVCLLFDYLDRIYFLKIYFFSHKIDYRIYFFNNTEIKIQIHFKYFFFECNVMPHLYYVSFSMRTLSFLIFLWLLVYRLEYHTFRYSTRYKVLIANHKLQVFLVIPAISHENPSFRARKLVFFFHCLP
jgi:hypothetical protein